MYTVAVSFPEVDPVEGAVHKETSPPSTRKSWLIIMFSADHYDGRSVHR